MIVDDHPATVVGLATIVTSNPGMKVVAWPGTIDEALSLGLARVDVCMLGIAEPLTTKPDDGNDPIRRLHARWPRSQVLVIAEHDDDDDLIAYLQRGAAGFVSKRATPPEIIDAVERVARGERHFRIQPPQFPTLDRLPTAPALSRRQRQVLDLLAKGKRGTDMAQVLEISEKTVSTHKSNLQKKLGVRTTAQIVSRARELGLL